VNIESNLSNDRYMNQTLILMIGGIGGSVLTFLIQRYGVSVVVASCIVGLIGALCGHLFSLPHLSLVIFAGSFAGMTSASLASIPIVVFAGALTAIIYQLSLNIFAGMGGRLGFIAFVSTVVAVYLLMFMKKILIILMKA